MDETNVLLEVFLTLYQDDRKVTASFTHENEEYVGWLRQFGEELNDTNQEYGNVIFWSLWTGDLDFLESPPCLPETEQDYNPDYFFTIQDMNFLDA